MDLASSLHRHFGFSSFRAGQQEAIHSLLSQHHTLVVMPTGAGKSLIFQFSALQLDGITLVISPLIALMKDQVDSLTRRHIPATYINSALPASEQDLRLRNLSQSKYRLVYVAPERLRNVQFLNALKTQTISLLAVDEAHCVSEWGHDFRPDYLYIAQARAALGNPLTAALTATATPQVQKDIVRLLGLGESTCMVTGFNRPNLTLDVRYASGLPSKLRALSELLSPRKSDTCTKPQVRCCQSDLPRQTDFQGATIIYTGTRRDAEEVTEFVRDVIPIPTEFYHAGLLAEERTRIQNDFITGKLNIICATNAFGMGIDRADVRQVIHYSLPGSLEAYYQEAGRAGRDGLPAKATLLYDPQDRALQEFFIRQSELAIGDLRAIHNAIRNGEQVWTTTDELSRITGLHPVQIKVGLSELERAGTLEHLGDEGYRMLFHKGEWKPKGIEQAITNNQLHLKHRQIQLNAMSSYAESNSCRCRILLNHFGDTGSAKADNCCDNCRSAQALQSQSVTRIQKNENELLHGESIALIILDAVGKLKPHVGREKLAQILKGSKAQEILKYHYDRSAYYAKFARLKKFEIIGLLDRLINLDYLKIIGGNYPVIALTPRGEIAIKQKAAIVLKSPKILETVDVMKARAKFEASLSSQTSQVSKTSEIPGSSDVSVERIVKLGESKSFDAIPELIQSLRNENGNIRRLAASALGKIRDTRAVEPLLKLLEHEEKPQVRQYAVKALGAIGDKRAEEILRQIATSENEMYYTRDSAKTALRKLGQTPRHPTSHDISQPARPLEDTNHVRQLILACVYSLPGKLPRSDVARLLVGSESERVAEYQSHPLYGYLRNMGRSEVMAHVDELLEGSNLAQDERGYLLIPKYEASLNSSVLSTAYKTHTTQHDKIESFLNQPHPRPLIGSWRTGWSLGFHSRITGADWSRSGVGDLTYRLKYDSDTTVLPALVQQTLTLFQTHPEMEQADFIIPVPSSTERKVSPVHVFCEALAGTIGVPVQAVVTKSRQTQPQKEMRTFAQKRANVAGAFALRSDIKAKFILLVDDLFDSGATLEEITRLLLKHGAAQVNVLTLTRTIHSDT